MKKIFKIFIYLVVIFILLVIILAVIAKLAENKITDIALKKVSEDIEAPVSIEEVSFNLLRKFPYATIELYGVSIGSPQKVNRNDSLVMPSDTIFSCKKLYVSVKSKPLLDNKFEIVKVDLEDANLNYQVDTSGATNIDFLIESEEDTTMADSVPSKPLSLILNDLSVWNIVVNYNDESLKTKAKVKIPELKVNAEIQDDNMLASVVGAVNLSNCSFSETNLYLMNNTDIDFDIDYENDSVSIKHLNVDTDGAGFSLLGNVVLGDKIKTDIKISKTELDLDELIKYAPKEILEEYGIDKVKGKVNLDATATGVYSDSELPQVDLNISFKDGNLKTADYPELKNISFAGKASNGILRNNQSTQADFSSFHFETEKSKFDIAFSLLDIDHPKYAINTVLDINVGEFKDFIPDSLIKNIDGNIVAKLSTKGELPDSIGNDFVDYIMANSQAEVYFNDFNIDVDSVLSIKNFSTGFNYKPNNISIKDLNVDVPVYNAELKNTSFNVGFKGSINSPSDLQLDIKSYHLETKGTVITGFAKVKNLDNPQYEFNSKIKTDLNEVKVMLPDSLVKTLKGNVELNVKSKATLNLDSLSTQYMDIVFKNSEFNMSLNDVYAELYDEPLYRLENFSGKVNMTPDAITINKMKGVAAGMDFEIDSTSIENLYNTVIRNQPEKLLVNTRIHLGDIDYKMFAPFMVSDTTQTNEEPQEKTESIPTNYSMELKGVAAIKSVTYDSVLLEDISTLFNITDSVYIIDQFKFKAFNGLMNSSVKYSLKPDDKSVIETKHIVEEMDVKKLLTDFNDFEDYYEPAIRAENLSGLFSTKLFTRINMVGDSLVQEDIRVKGDIKLEQGGVYNYEPATNLSKFTGIDELDNIQFKTLDSKIFIFKNAIYVPETFISSTALNINAYGMQSFGEDYEYHLEIKLSDILFGKSKKQKRRESKGGDAYEDERNMRQIVVYSLDGKNKNGFDNESLQRKMKNKIVLQDKMLNFRFDPRLVNFETNVYQKNK